MLGNLQSGRRAVAAAASVRPQMSVERLEDRTVPAITATLLAGTLYVAGSPTIQGMEIGITAEDKLVHVFDGTKPVAAFDGVNNINARPDGGANLRVDLGTQHAFGNLSVQLSRGPNSVEIGPGQLASAMIVGGVGADNIKVKDLNVRTMTIDTGRGGDRVFIDGAAVGALSVRAASTVELGGATSAGSVVINNQVSPMVVNTNARINGSLTVFAVGGTMNLGGAVEGNVAYWNNARGSAPANLNVTGKVAGSLQMTGTSQSDTVVVDVGSGIGGSLTLSLGGASDQVVLAGTVGVAAASSVFVDLGDGHDHMTVADTARILTTNAQFSFGAGDDSCVIAKDAHFLRLALDGGAGNDTLLAPFSRNLIIKAFENFR